jgi:hypothetical protein
LNEDKDESNFQLKFETLFFKNHFLSIENLKITEPVKYLSRKDFLEFHLDKIFQKQNQPHSWFIISKSPLKSWRYF